MNKFKNHALKVAVSSHFGEILLSPKNTARSAKMDDRVNEKLSIFNRPVQKEGSLP